MDAVNEDAFLGIDGNESSDLNPDDKKSNPSVENMLGKLLK